MAVETTHAAAMSGVVAVLTAEDMVGVCRPWRAEHALFVDARVPSETPLAHQRVRYVGEPVAIVVAEDGDAARDAAERVILSIDALPALLDPVAALAPDAVAIHPDLAGGGAANLHHTIESSAGRNPEGTAVSLSLTLARVAPQPMETRGVVAEWDPADGLLMVYQSHQHPHMMQDVYSRLLGIEEHRVRVVCEDVGGAFGAKQQLHPDEMATVCASVILGAPVRYVPTRSESLIADAQARDHKMQIVAIVDREARRIVGFKFDDLCGIGAFGHFPRTSFGEAGQATRLIGAPYAVENVTARARLAFQNRPHLGHYRGVGHPVACLATEAAVDEAARLVGEHPISFRRRHLIDPAALPVTTPLGIKIDRYRMHECLDVLEAHFGDSPRGDRNGVLYGLGVACLVELVASGPRYYGDGRINISVDETAVIRMEPSGVVRLATANTDQGQGADQALAQIVADVLGIEPSAVAVTSGDSANCPYGGGAFASRGTTLGGKAARDAALRLRERLLACAALLLQRHATELTLKNGVVAVAGGDPVMDLAELSRTCHFKPHLFPPEHDAALIAVGRHTPQADAMICCAAFGASVAVDPETGQVSLTRLVVAHDGGTLVNPVSVDSQIHGGTVQGLGQALQEAIRVDKTGQPITGSFMDYAMPRADDVPPVDVVHLPPLAEDGFAPRGVGEAGTSGAPAAIFNAVNDALGVRGVGVRELPITPETVWQALRL